MMSAIGPPHTPLPTGSPSSGAARSKYSRGACTECSRRHHKCDTAHPECAPCKMAGLTCTWPEKKRGPRLYDEVVGLRGRVGMLELTVGAQQADIANLRSTVETLLRAIGVQNPHLHRQHQQLDHLVIPLTPVSSGPPSSFPSSAESSPHPRLHALPAQHGALLGVPPSDNAFPRDRARTASGTSSSSDGSFHLDGTTHLDVPHRHARRLSSASSCSSFEHDAYSQASSPYLPALHVEPEIAWSGPARFGTLVAPSAPEYTDIPITMNVESLETEPGRSDPGDMFNSNMWGGAPGASGAG